MTGTCMYCSRDGKNRLDDGEEPSFVCSSCWAILKNPTTALPFIRGHLTLQLRGTVSEEELTKRMNLFMGKIAGWKRAKLPD